VKQALLINEKEITAIMDEVKNMLDYKVRHYVHYDHIASNNEKNIHDHLCLSNINVYPMGIWINLR